VYLDDFRHYDLGVRIFDDMFLLSMYADRQWQAEIEMYGNTVKIFIPDGDATIVVRRKEEVVRLD